MITGKFIVPDYYPRFRCKGSLCRSCCCDGWTITISQEEYFRLRDLDLSGDRKERRDAYVGILPHPSEERYARINLNFFGECPRRLSNGYCGLQVDVGEENIPSVCRYYPRAPRLYPLKECSLSNSCEWVIEYRIHDPKPLSFSERKLSFCIKEEKVPPFPNDALSLRKEGLSLRKDRSLPFSKRLLGLSEILSLEKPSLDFKALLLALKDKFSRSFSLSDYLSSVKEPIPCLESCERKRKSLFQDYDFYREKIFSNHRIFSGFPYADSICNKEETYNGLLVIYAFYLLLREENLKDGERIPFVDLTGKYFRVVEHSNRYKLINALIKEEKE